MGSQNPFLYSHFHIHPPSFTRTQITIQYLQIQVDLVHISFVFVFVRGFFLLAGAPCATSSPVCNQVTLSLSHSIPIQPNPLFLLQKTPLSGFVPCATISLYIVIQLFSICVSTPFLQFALCQYNVCNAAHKNENGSHLKLIHHFCRFVHISYESAPRVTLDGISLLLFPPL